MKSIFRYIILILSSLGLAILGFNTLPADNLLTDILAENRIQDGDNRNYFCRIFCDVSNYNTYYVFYLLFVF